MSLTDQRGMRLGLVFAALVTCVGGGLAVGIDLPSAVGGMRGDEATYYMMAHSIAEDGDLTYRREDLERVWREYPGGPSGVFLKRGRRIVDIGSTPLFPFVQIRTEPDPVPDRLFFGKAFIYSLCAAPFVRVFGTRGFLLFHTLLVALVAWCGCLFFRAQMTAEVAAVLNGAYLIATVLPVYFVWISPEIFNFVLGFLAYFLWLYKEVTTSEVDCSPWLMRRSTDLASAALLGMATFSKPTTALLFIPIAVWLLTRRRWLDTFKTSLVFAIVVVALFAVNMATCGEWNYQGGDRKTFAGKFPFQSPQYGFDIVQETHGRDDAQADIIFKPTVFWANLKHNVVWFFVGRYAGAAAYLFPLVFSLGMFLLGVRRRPTWQYAVFAALVGQMLVFVIGLPYTWGGGGGSVGNRYLIGAYGLSWFLVPPLTRLSAAFIPWIGGAMFMAPLIVSPIAASSRPSEPAKVGMLRLLPIELTMVYDWPINTDATRVRVPFGKSFGSGDPWFQIYFLDDNAYVPEEDRSFWVRGRSRAEFVIKTDRPMRRVVFTLTAGDAPTQTAVSLARRRTVLTLRPGEVRQVSLNLGEGFLYQGRWPVWPVNISSSDGATPLLVNGSTDTRYLGVRVKPTLVE